MKVSFVTHTVFHYRQAFHELVRSLLAKSGVDYCVYYGQPDRNEGKKGDAVDLTFGSKINNKYIYTGQPPLIWQPVARETLKSDLVIVHQENRLLLNYLLLTVPKRLRPKVAFFGHGRNFQSRNPEGPAERWKRWWSTRSDWWFAYTEETRRHVESLGFARDRITVFNNAVDTTALDRDLRDVTPSRLQAFRDRLGLTGSHVGLYIGGLYPDKRLEFLVQAADQIRARIPDFELLVVGAGPSESELKRLAETRPWLRVLGPLFGAEKAEVMTASHLLLMPGLVGLVVVDSGMAALPLVTTTFPWHSPEIAYLQQDVNGVIVNDWQSTDAYADTVADLLLDERRRGRMAVEARRIAEGFTIESMAHRFATGVEEALRTA